MKIQTIIIGFLTVSIFSVAGIFDHDKAYYTSHLEDAAEQIKSCKKEMAIARIDEDKEKVMALMKDQECKDAFDAIKEHKRKLQKERYALEQKKREEEKAKKEAQFKIDYQKQLVLQKQLPYEDFVKIKKTCGFSFGTPTAECKVFNELKQIRKQDAVKELMSKYHGDDLINYNKKECNKGSQLPNCDISYYAANKDREDTITKLSLDKEAFKKVYTECSKKIIPLRKKMKWEQINKITQSFKCSTALTAARSYHIMGFGTVIK